MKGFVLGVVVTLVAIAACVFAVSRLGLYPIGADNPPGTIEQMLASRAMDVYADRHAPCRARDTRLRRTNAGATRSDPVAHPGARSAGAGGNRHWKDGGVRPADRPAVDGRHRAAARDARARPGPDA